MALRERSSAALLGGLAAIYALPAASLHAPALARFFDVELELPTGSGVALTFDDGPHEHGTPAVLDALDTIGARATFYLVGEQVERLPGLAAEIVERGHAVGVHSHRHRLEVRLTPLQIRRDLVRVDRAIFAATGRRPMYFRPPYGVLSTPSLIHARRSGWTTQLWSSWGRDWRSAATAESITSDVAMGLKSGAIVLLHDADHYGARGSWRSTVAALPLIAEVVAERGLTFAEPPAGA